MITSLTIAILIISSQFVIPSIHIQSPLETLQNQVMHLINNGGSYVSNLDYKLLVLSIAYNIGKLPVLDMRDVNTVEQYHNFVDKVNGAIKILNNNKLGMQIPTLQYTQEEYDKISKVITKYVPLVSEYNDMISAAKNTNPSNQDSINNFYVKTTVFSIMLTLVVSAAYAAPSYALVGTVYRSSGLTTMAFKCPACVSMVLSEAHWAIRGMFVSTTATVLDAALTTSKVSFSKVLPK